MAAGRTVEHGRVHSLHAYFLRPGDPTVPILYEVDRIRDGRSFTTRRVVAIQHGQAIFNLAASFHVYEEGLDHQFPMPEVPRPRDACPRSSSGWSPGGTSWPTGSTGPIPSTSATSASCPGTSTGPGEPVQRVWIRADGDPARRPAAACLRGGLRLGHVAVRHHARPPRRALGRRRLHGGEPGPLHVVPPALPGRRWLLYDMDSPAAAGGRGLARGFLFDRDGPLCVSMVQEGLMRLVPEPRPERRASARPRSAPRWARSRAARRRCRAGGAGRSWSPGRASPASAPASRRCGGWRRGPGTSRAGTPWPGR